jgi:site-specific DNA recombinase
LAQIKCLVLSVCVFPIDSTKHCAYYLRMSAHNKQTKTRAVAYVRVSTDKQADHGVSLDAQEAKVRAYASLYDIDLVEIVVDAGVSAKTLDRPGLAKVLGMVKRRTVDAVLVCKLDRLTRSVSDLGRLVEDHFSEKKNSSKKAAALLSVEEQIDTRTAGGRLVLNVLGSVAQWEREAIGERTKTAMRHKASQGEYTGGKAPYGFQVASDGVHLEECEAEQAVMRIARALRDEGLSLRKVAALLAERGMLTREGNTFAAHQVTRLVAA